MNRKPRVIESIKRRVSRRQTLKGLGAFALTSTTLEALGCSSDSAPAAAAGGSAGATSGSVTAAGAAAPAAAAAGKSAGGAAGATVSGSIGASPVGAAGKPAQPAAAGASAGGGGGGSATAGTAAPASSSAGTSAAAGGGGATAGSTAGTAGGSAAGAGAAPGGALSSLQCIVTPAMTEGPFFVEEKLNRANLVMGETADAIAKAVPLKLIIGVFDVDGMTCTPLSGATVDIWHADALGVYSDVASGVVQSTDTRGKKFLRGYQTTDEQGIVTFETIYPGWYMSRTIHIHFKLRMLGSGSSAREFTSQMFFDEAVNALVLAKAPYNTHPGMRDILNDDDHIFNGTPSNAQPLPAGKTPPGKSIMPTLEMTGEGYTATLKIGLQA